MLYRPDDINVETPFLPAVAVFILDSIYHQENGEEKTRELEKLIEKEVDPEGIASGVENAYYRYLAIDTYHPFYNI